MLTMAVPSKTHGASAVPQSLAGWTGISGASLSRTCVVPFGLALVSSRSAETIPLTSMSAVRTGAVHDNGRSVAVWK